ncbi:hypothetical protein ACVWYN_001773 [Pedobacter sp. UYP24]
MAILDGKQLTGLIGNLVTKKGKNGKTILQTAPTEVKQTEASKTAASIFGNASALGLALRLKLYAINANFQDGGMVNRLTTVNRDIMQHCFNKASKTYAFDDSSFNKLKGFEFNINSLFSNFFWETPTIAQEDNILKVTIPQFNIPEQLKFPKNTNYCEISVCVCYVVLEQSLTRHYELQTFSVTDMQQTIEAKAFSFSAPEGCLCVVAMGLGYFSKYENIQTIYNSKKFNPAAIVGQTLTPGTFIEPAARVENGRSYAKEWSIVHNLSL